MTDNQHPKLDVRKFICPEIQGKAPTGCFSGETFVLYSYYLVWIPTSDTLVEMIDHYCHCHYCILGLADAYIAYKENTGYWELRLPWNEFWLEVLFWWNWKKIWDGKEWKLL